MQPRSSNGKPGDVSEESDIIQLVERAVTEFGGIDFAYANAGIGGGQGLEPSVEEFKRVVDVNLVCPFILMKHAIPHMSSRGKGSFIVTASVAGVRANAGVTPYNASKGGVILLAQSMAFAVHGSGVRVNTICPGLIETGMFDSAKVHETTGTRPDKHNPLGRAGDSSEIASVALFLASDDSPYVNAQAIAVCGGLTPALPLSSGQR